MAPEPSFALTVQCPTCSGRLRIRNPALVGQIVPCPRCQGLVLIQQDQDPEQNGLRVSVDDPVDSQIETREAIEETRPPESHTQPAMAGPPPVAWETPQVKRSRQILLVSLLAIFGMFSVSVVFWLFVRAMSNGGRDEVALIPPVDAFPVVPAEGNGGNVPQEAAEPEGKEAGEGIGIEKPVVSPEGTESASQEPSVGSVQADATKGETAPAMTGASELPAMENGKAPGEVVGVNPPGRTFAPAEAIGATEGGAKPEAVPMLDLPPELRQFIPLLNDEAPPLSPEMSLPAPLTADELRLQLNLPPPPDERLHPSPAEVVAVRSRLEKPLFGLQTDQGNLASLLATMEQLAGVPIWMDQATLDLGEVDIMRPLQVRVTSKTIGDTIREIAVAAGCEAVEAPTGFVCVRLSDKEILRRIEPALKFDDLQDEAVWVADYIRRIAGEVNEAGELQSHLTVNAEQRKIEVEEVERGAEGWRAAMALETLRMARGMPQRLPARVTSRWMASGAPPLPRSPEDTEHALKASYALPLSQWMMMLGQAQKRVVVFDWPSMWQHGLVPTKTFLPWTEGVTQQRVIEQLLSPYDLRVYEDGAGVWWVGSETAYQNRGVFLAVPLGGELAQRGDALLPSLTQIFKCDEANLPAVLEPQKGVLLTRMPRGMAEALGELLK